MKKINIAPLILLMILISFIYTADKVRDFWLKAPSDNAEVQIFEVERGTGAGAIASELESLGIIDSDFWFNVYSRLFDDPSSYQAGEFLLTYGMSYKDISETLKNAKSNQISVTFPEGLTVREMGVILENQMGIDLDLWLATASDYEGYLFPDTYFFPVGASADQIALTMRENFNRKTEALNLDAEDVIVASIIEKEVRKLSEMKAVSDIIRKRLEIGMPLQMDSTVNYVTGGNRPSVTFEDLEVDSPYNTYRNAGLPPGPISNPGLNALEASVNPTSNPYYFFLTDPLGNVYYAETFEGHVANRIYLR